MAKDLFLSDFAMADIVPCHISNPLYLQASPQSGHVQTISLREHLSAAPASDPELPLILFTFHPGYSAGSYENRDYFELLTPLLFSACRGRYRLRIFTINHPGHDLPPESKIDRFQTEQYGIDFQPAVILPALRWLLLRELAGEEAVILIAYGHSMGGLALAQCDLQTLAAEVQQQGRRLHIEKVLSAPAMFLSRDAKRFLRPLDGLHTLKQSLGRLPLYDRVATSIYRALARPLHRLSANTYSLNPDDTFLNFRRQNPFLLLQLGRELLQHNCRQQDLADLLGGTHLLVYQGDKMVDSPALLRAATTVREQGIPVHVHILKSLHNAERENPQAVAHKLQEILENTINS